ncbi:MAG: NUDIX hydrolase [Anaerolineae bacterium]|nr:NUDIX hydrolase [Anaerolineae bacterium]
MSRSQQIFSGKVVKLALHEIRLPDGSTAVRELIEHQGAVGVVALDEDQQVLLVRQFRIGAGRDLYEIPAGILEPGETPEVCAARELREEVGYQPGTLEALGGFFTAPGYTTEFIHLFLARNLIAAPLPQDHDEFVECVRLPLIRALAMIDQGEIVDSKSLIALLRIARRLGL